MCFLYCLKEGKKDVELLAEDSFLSRQLSIFLFFICIFVTLNKTNYIIINPIKYEKVKDIIYDACCSSTYVAAQ